MKRASELDLSSSASVRMSRGPAARSRVGCSDWPSLGELFFGGTAPQDLADWKKVTQGDSASAPRARRKASEIIAELKQQLADAEADFIALRDPLPPELTRGQQNWRRQLPLTTPRRKKNSPRSRVGFIGGTAISSIAKLAARSKFKTGAGRLARRAAEHAESRAIDVRRNKRAGRSGQSPRFSTR